MKRIIEALRAPVCWRGAGEERSPYLEAEDASLLPIIHCFVDERPTWGYRCLTALVNRELARKGLPAVNRKQVHQIMQQSRAALETLYRPARGPHPRRQGHGSTCAGALTLWSRMLVRCSSRSPGGSKTTTRPTVTQDALPPREFIRNQT
jgi:hypothetical protein